MPPSPLSTSSNGNNSSRLSHLRTKPLTPKQERRLVAYLDDQFLHLTRGFKKRTSPTTHVPTLHKYITEARKLLSFMLQIPPVDPSTELRIQFMLRLTGDVLSAVVGYELVPPPRPSSLPSSTTPQPPTPALADRTNGANGNGSQEREDRRNGREERVEEDEEPRVYTAALRKLLDWLDDLDQAWLAVLQSQVWDPELGEGVDLMLDVSTDIEMSESNGATATTRSRPLKSTPISQTDVTRLRSLLITSIASLEEWLSKTKPPSTSTTGRTAGGEDDVAGMLERLGLLEEFDDLFSRTMDFLGGFSGGYVIEPETVVGGDGELEDEDMSDMVEVVMSGCS